MSSGQKHALDKIPNIRSSFDQGHDSGQINARKECSKSNCDEKLSNVTDHIQPGRALWHIIFTVLSANTKMKIQQGGQCTYQNPESIKNIILNKHVDGC